MYSRNCVRAHANESKQCFSEKLLRIAIILTTVLTCAIAGDGKRLQPDYDFKDKTKSVKPVAEEEAVTFDSRKHRNHLPTNLDPTQFPITAPTPNLAKEFVDDWEGADDYNYPLTDYDSNYTMWGDFDMSDLRKKLYQGPVCALVDVRNTPVDLRDLENCTIVNGFVQITFMHETREGSFEGYSFPKLRVITEYLLIYRVYGLRSLKKLFPNLAVISGRQLFYNYAMILFENPQLQEIGLGNLRRIERGKVRIQKNSKMCYLDTVDWERLGVKLGTRGWPSSSPIRVSMERIVMSSPK